MSALAYRQTATVIILCGESLQHPTVRSLVFSLPSIIWWTYWRQQELKCFFVLTQAAFRLYFNCLFVIKVFKFYCFDKISDWLLFYNGNSQWVVWTFHPNKSPGWSLGTLPRLSKCQGFRNEILTAQLSLSKEIWRIFRIIDSKVNTDIYTEISEIYKCNF